MDAYFDSAIIVKLYVKEATSPDAIRLVGAYAAPYALTQWQELEVKNAIRLKAFRVEITAAEMNQSIAAFEQDVATGRWQRPAYTATTIEQKAEDLSAGYSAALGCRTLDIIHVAAALVLGAKEFVTFDARQGALAKKIGLTVKP
jgi:predicted nucleic acid-binding protein